MYPCFFARTSHWLKDSDCLSPHNNSCSLRNLKTTHLILTWYGCQSYPKLCNNRRMWWVWAQFCSIRWWVVSWQRRLFGYWNRTSGQDCNRYWSEAWRLAQSMRRWSVRSAFWGWVQCWFCCQSNGGRRSCFIGRICTGVEWLWLFFLGRIPSW